MTHATDHPTGKTPRVLHAVWSAWCWLRRVPANHEQARRWQDGRWWT